MQSRDTSPSQKDTGRQSPEPRSSIARMSGKERGDWSTRVAQHAKELQELQTAQLGAEVDNRFRPQSTPDTSATGPASQTSSMEGQPRTALGDQSRSPQSYSQEAGPETHTRTEVSPHTMVPTIEKIHSAVIKTARRNEYDLHIKSQKMPRPPRTGKKASLKESNSNALQSLRNSNSLNHGSGHRP